ncbi:DUF6114 domain-containing protein [Natrinema salsiterrestre]|uniref:DUF6114 domain-containing protein n=1 Tax=Natrinema salsiterrestre TaxID=2950540 RepID=A0A9Q4Q2A4_9EURY|nr:DUF6114 domain-containing protein [Natrinema salsiterrestre]MDF9744632.1 DUF6114 domain-containing protein [Natrinema salsiterrestre]
MNDERLIRVSVWRDERPFWGGTILTIAGLVIAVVPLTLAFRFGMGTTPYVLVGLSSAFLVSLSGILSLRRPERADYFGAVGILFAVASIFGALGGFGLGTVLGMVGGSLCLAWVPADGAADDPSPETESVLSRLRSRCRGAVDSLSQER